MKISIITINYNNKEGLDHTIKSVVGQSTNNFEYIIIDGGSTDGSLDVINLYSNRISHWISEKDHGIYNAMNKGISIANGKYCLFLNSGDYLYDNNVVSELLSHTEEKDDFIIGRVFFSNTGEYSNVDQNLTMLRFFQSSIPHPSTLIKRSLLLQNKYDENYRIVSDWKFFIQELILKNASFRILNTVVACFDSTGISSQNIRLVEKERNLVLNELLPNRIRIDYLRFINGSDYKQTTYDEFFRKLSRYKYSKYIYSISVLFVRLISFFKKSAAFAFDYPIKLNRK